MKDKMIIYVRTNEEALEQLERFGKQNVRVVITPDEVFEAVQTRHNEELQTKANRLARGLEEVRAISYNPEHAKRALLKWKLFRRYSVSDEELERGIVEFLARYQEDKKLTRFKRSMKNFIDTNKLNDEEDY